ncbi:Translation initiation factor IF-2 [Candidatus Tremblaya princeps]|uniref:Translation initiation factor IF-2 n=1 Tax=Tremblaya princeps TaxID=189385 RepID=A0A143WNL5_TREPR|nr:Translation initiation factor IF-2 [Candidatus Tremblaya princeps]
MDHGKTTLLAALTSNRSALREAGGITQNVYAYDAAAHGAQFILVDTPGHSAFGQSARRGIAIADIVVLVVSSDSEPDERSMRAALEAAVRGRELVVAISKTDKDANRTGTRRIRRRCEELMRAVQVSIRPRFVCVSAHSGEGILDMLQALRAAAHGLRLHTLRNVPAHGVVLDATISVRAGVMATLLVQMGMLACGDRITIRGACGCVRFLRDAHGAAMKRAYPYSVVVAQCMACAPLPGQRFMSTQRRPERQRVYRATYRGHGGTAAGMALKLPCNQACYVVRAMNHALLGAALRVLRTESGRGMVISVVRAGLGTCSPSDAALAAATGAAIITVGQKAPPCCQSGSPQAESYGTVYELREALRSRSALSVGVRSLGVVRARVERLFGSVVGGVIVGCKVLSGVLRASSGAKIFRCGAEVGRCDIRSLRFYREEVTEVASGGECGVCAQCIIPSTLQLCTGDELEVEQR